MADDLSPGIRDLGTAPKPRPFRGPFSEAIRLFAWAYLKLSGWKLEGAWPADPKLVGIAAPHTSNWDGINMLAAAAYFRVKLSWMGKKSLTTGPFGWIVKATGCVPVDRASAGDLVEQMKAAFDARDGLVLAVAPEGTRSAKTEWKSGFYRIAVAAEVPLLITVLDYGAKTIRLGGVLHPSGDYERDMALILAKYDGVTGKIGEKFQLPEGF